MDLRKQLKEKRPGGSRIRHPWRAWSAGGSGDEGAGDVRCASSTESSGRGVLLLSPSLSIRKQLRRTFPPNKDGGSTGKPESRFSKQASRSTISGARPCPPSSPNRARRAYQPRMLLGMKKQVSESFLARSSSGFDVNSASSSSSTYSWEHETSSSESSQNMPGDEIEYTKPEDLFRLYPSYSGEEKTSGELTDAPHSSFSEQNEQETEVLVFQLKIPTTQILIESLDVECLAFKVPAMNAGVA